GVVLGGGGGGGGGDRAARRRWPSFAGFGSQLLDFAGRRDARTQAGGVDELEACVGDEALRQSSSSYLKEQFFAFFQPSDNKLAMKLFGNRNALLKEKRRQQQTGRWIIHPCSSFRFYWDLLMLMLLITNLVVLPVAISFFNDDLSAHWIVFNCVSDTIFMSDIAADRQVLRSFLVLIGSGVLNSMDYIFLALNQRSNVTQLVHAGRALKILRLAKLLSLLRLLRLSRLVRYVSQWEEFLVPAIQDFPKDSWVAKLNIQDAYWFRQYTWALFKAMSHMLSIGYGQHPPTSLSEAWITIVSMMTGATCYALFVGHSAALIQSFDTSKRLYREKFKQVEEYMAYRKLPRALRQRIANYYEHRYQGKMFDENDILGELSECLREDFVSEVVTKLRYEVFQPGDLIIKEGTIGAKMYFIQEGIVDIITKEGEVATSLSDGSYFGEICLLTNAKRVASVRAETYCNVYSLERDNFLSVLDNHPLMRRTMESVAAERLSKIGQNPQLVSDREDLKEDLSLVKEIVDRAAEADASAGGHCAGCNPDSVAIQVGDVECPGARGSSQAESKRSSGKSKLSLRLKARAARLGEALPRASGRQHSP
uniref:Cyclic nucleotide-binding domain-containing protein n=1 Tax=Macrostomum lignano TaxID=282301 RepID=A0A1I8GLZ6_9PLAT